MFKLFSSYKKSKFGVICIVGFGKKIVVKKFSVVQKKVILIINTPAIGGLSLISAPPFQRRSGWLDMYSHAILLHKFSSKKSGLSPRIIRSAVVENKIFWKWILSPTLRVFTLIVEFAFPFHLVSVKEGAEITLCVLEIVQRRKLVHIKSFFLLYDEEVNVVNKKRDSPVYFYKLFLLTDDETSTFDAYLVITYIFQYGIIALNRCLPPQTTLKIFPVSYRLYTDVEYFEFFFDATSYIKFAIDKKRRFRYLFKEKNLERLGGINTRPSRVRDGILASRRKLLRPGSTFVGIFGESHSVFLLYGVLPFILLTKVFAKISEMIFKKWKKKGG